MASEEKSYTRNVGPDMMEKLTKGEFAQFVSFVKEHGDLALCFRGNCDHKNDKVIIYKHNFTVWELSIKNKKPIVTIKLNGTRFIRDWAEKVAKPLMEVGFRGSDLSKDYADMTKDDFVKEHLKENKSGPSYAYDARDLSYELTNTPQDKKLIETSYSILGSAIEKYTKTGPQPTDYIKKYYLNGQADDDDCKTEEKDTLEKRVQQEIFRCNHKWLDGLFIYDLEFEQPKIDGESNAEILKNKTDLLGIRFEDKKMTSICLIEVKSKLSSLKGTSGVDVHLKRMIDYIKAKKPDGDYYMSDRKREAFAILKQYQELGFYDLKKWNFRPEDFEVLDEEIIFVFTNELERTTKEEDNNLKVEGRYPKVCEILDGFDDYDQINVGDEADNSFFAKIKTIKKY